MHGSELLEGLTDPQREAVSHTEGPLLVLAAAGSGKTRVITRRIARLIADGVPPWSVLALTFTNKAAGEMRERVHDLIVGPQGDPRDRRLRGLTVSTFHSLCARLLRRYAERAELPGLKPDYTIYDTSDQQALMKRTLAGLNLSTSNWPPRSVLGAISNAKNDLLDAEAYEARAGDFYSKQIAKIYSSYSAAMRKAGAIDFDDLLLLTALMLSKRAEIRAECHDRWRYLLIDEYQDTNRAQFQIASLLAGDLRAPGGSEQEPEAPAAGLASPNICVVGDPDQAIYGWRGADISNILDFEQSYPGCRVITLGENFRSTQPVLEAADRLIKHNTRRKDKPLFTTRPGGETPEAVICRDERREAELVTDWFRLLHDVEEGEGEPVAWRDMAVFYRTNALSRVMEDALRGAGVPYVIARGTAFYDREEVRDALAYLRVVANPADDVSLERVVNKPTRGLGKTSLDRVRARADSEGVPLFHALRDAGSIEGISAQARNGGARLVGLVDGWTGSGTFMGASVAGTLHDLVERVIEESGLRVHYQKQAATTQSESDAEKIDNLDELISSARQFEDEYDPAADPLAFPGADVLEGGGEAEVPELLAMLRGYLESVALVADADAVDPAQGAVTLMTLHAAKGLEFPAVAIIGLEEGLLPHSRAFESEADLEEERRLAFVGITRAMRRLRLTCSKHRTLRGSTERTIPSRFFEEIGHDLLRVSDQSDPLAGSVEDGPEGAAWGTDLSSASSGPSGPPDSTVASLESRLEGLRAKKTGESRAAAAQAEAKFPVGSQVRHPQFGVGEVRSVDGVGRSARIRVHFGSVGAKTLVLEYARLSPAR